MIDTPGIVLFKAKEECIIVIYSIGIDLKQLIDWNYDKGLNK